MVLGTEEQALLAELCTQLSASAPTVLRLGLRMISGQEGSEALLRARAPRFVKEGE